jgi:hypothetical protein
MPGTIGGCQFGMINVSTNKNVVRMSNNTIAPITYVPYIIFYINGRPFMRYQGPYDINEIRKFVIAVAENVQNKQKFNPKEVRESSKGNIPAYSIGHPIKGQFKKICYINFDGAYKK